MAKYYLQGQPANPKDSDLINYELDFRSKRQKRLNPSVSTVTFVKEDRELIMNHIATYGYSEGMFFDLEIKQGLVIKYELDFTTEAFEEGDTFITCEFRRLRGSDSFYNLADSISWRIVDFEESDFNRIDYIVRPPQQALYYISLSLALLSLRKEVANAAKEVQEGIADLVKAATPVGIPPAPDWGAIAVAAIKLAARIAYFILVFAALISTILEIIRLIFPLVRQFKCCSIKTLVEKGCQEAGYTLESNLLNSLAPLNIIPVPLTNPDKTWFEEVFMPQSLAYTEGYPTERDTFPLFGDLIEFIEEVYNAETKVSNGVVRIENETFFQQNPSGVRDEAFNLVPDNETVYKYNHDEQFRRKIFTQAIDVSEVNTLDDTNDTIFELRGDIISSPNGLKNLKGVTRISVDVSRATPKGSLNVVEKYAKTIAKAVDLFTGGDLSSQIENRKNVMVVSDQYFTTTKWAWLSGTKIDPNQLDYLGMSKIYSGYHVGKNNETNLKRITEKMPQALNLDEFLAIEQNNYVTLNGETNKILYVSFNDWDRFAEIDFEKRISNPNVKTTIVQ